MDIPSLQVNPSSLVNILTLRYDPTQKPSLPKYTSKNFVPSQEIPSLEKIEKLIIKNITSKIPKDTDSISIALSGGVDSTLVLAFMRKIFPKMTINAISVKFANSIDETIPAAKIAEKFEAKQIIINIENYLEELPRAISIIKQPFWDTHWYYVSKRAQSLSKFLASGDGGDEIFGGYTFRYKKFLETTTNTSTSQEKIKAYLSCHERDRVPDQDKLFHKDVNFSWNSIYNVLSTFFENNLDRLDQVLLADYNGKLLYNFSPVNNSLQEHFGLTSVSPFVSEDIISYFLPIQNKFKYNKNENIGKLLLRKLLVKYDADMLVTNEKLGFNVNTQNLWKKYGRRLCEKYLVGGYIVENNIINSNWIECYISKEDLEIKYVNKFLGLLAVEIWYRLFITKDLDSNTTLD